MIVNNVDQLNEDVNVRISDHLIIVINDLLEVIKKGKVFVWIRK